MKAVRGRRLLRVAGWGIPAGLMTGYRKSPDRDVPTRDALRLPTSTKSTAAPSGPRGVRRRGDLRYPVMSPAASPTAGPHRERHAWSSA